MSARKLLWLILIVGMLALLSANLWGGASAQGVMTVTPSFDATSAAAATMAATQATPQADRVLPPVGSNAGLVCGASVLVMIILGGVIWSTRRKKP